MYSTVRELPGRDRAGTSPRSDGFLWSHLGMPGWWWQLRDSQLTLGCEISLPGDMSWLCWDFLTVCALPKGACCLTCHPKAGLSPDPPSFLLFGGGISLEHTEADEDGPGGTPGHLGLAWMLSICLCPDFL